MSTNFGSTLINSENVDIESIIKKIFPNKTVKIIQNNQQEKFLKHIRFDIRNENHYQIIKTKLTTIVYNSYFSDLVFNKEIILLNNFIYNKLMAINYYEHSNYYRYIYYEKGKLIKTETFYQEEIENKIISKKKSELGRKLNDKEYENLYKMPELNYNGLINTIIDLEQKNFHFSTAHHITDYSKVKEHYYIILEDKKRFKDFFKVTINNDTEDKNELQYDIRKPIIKLEQIGDLIDFTKGIPIFQYILFYLCIVIITYLILYVIKNGYLLFIPFILNIILQKKRYVFYKINFIILRFFIDLFTITVLAGGIAVIIEILSFKF